MLFRSVITPDDWPPLVHPELLADFESYTAWERHMVARCADPGLTPEDVIATLQRDAALVRMVRPGEGESIVGAIASLPRAGVHAPLPLTLESSLAHHADVMRAVPDEWRPEPDEQGLDAIFRRDVRPAWPAWTAPLKRYLAAKAFATWTAYQGQGLLTIVRGLEAALALVRVEAARQCRNAGRAIDAELLREAIRQADFALNHLAGGDELAERWSGAEDAG